MKKMISFLGLLCAISFIGCGKPDCRLLNPEKVKVIDISPSITNGEIKLSVTMTYEGKTIIAPAHSISFGNDNDQLQITLLTAKVLGRMNDLNVHAYRYYKDNAVEIESASLN